MLELLPVMGYVFVLAGTPAVVRRKGYLLGFLATALDLAPVLCRLKVGVETFTRFDP